MLHQHRYGNLPTSFSIGTYSHGRGYGSPLRGPVVSRKARHRCSPLVSVRLNRSTITQGVPERVLGTFKRRQRVPILLRGLAALMRLWNVGSWLRGGPYPGKPHHKCIRHIVEKISLLQGPAITRVLDAGL